MLNLGKLVNRWFCPYLHQYLKKYIITIFYGYIFQMVIKMIYFFGKSLSPNVGLEPTTLRLRVSCSTDWASRAVGSATKQKQYLAIKCKSILLS